MSDPRPNKYEASCSLCRLKLQPNEGLVTQRDVQIGDGTEPVKKWITDCADVEGCHQRIRLENLKRASGPRMRAPYRKDVFGRRRD